MDSMLETLIEADEMGEVIITDKDYASLHSLLQPYLDEWRNNISLVDPIFGNSVVVCDFGVGGWNDKCAIINMSSIVVEKNATNFGFYEYSVWATRFIPACNAPVLDILAYLKRNPHNTAAMNMGLLSHDVENTRSSDRPSKVFVFTNKSYSELGHQWTAADPAVLVHWNVNGPEAVQIDRNVVRVTGEISESIVMALMDVL